LAHKFFGLVFVHVHEFLLGKFPFGSCTQRVSLDGVILGGGIASC